MNLLHLPSRQIYHYVLTGKFKAPDENWKHGYYFLGEYELFVMTEGTLYLNYNGENFTVKQGEYLLLPPCNAFRQGFKSAYSSFYWLHFSVSGNFPIIKSTLHLTDVSHSNVSDAGASAHAVSGSRSLSYPPSEGAVSDPDPFFAIPQTGKIPKLEKLVVLMKQLQDEVKNKYPVMTLDSMTTSILMELYGQLCSVTPGGCQSPLRKQLHSDIVDYIQSNLASNLKISDIAVHFGYNEKYLSHLFAQITGIPLKQFILSCKIDAANFMLTDSNMPIQEIAKKLGFADNHNFSRTYRNFTGLTPTEYRNAFAGRILNHE